MHFAVIAPERIQLDKPLTQVVPSPDPKVAINLFTFLAQRFTKSWTGLNCHIILDMQSPIKLVNSNGVTIDATFNLVSRATIMENSIRENDQSLIDSNNPVTPNTNAAAAAITNHVGGLISIIAVCGVLLIL